MQWFLIETRMICIDLLVELCNIKIVFCPFRRKLAEVNLPTEEGVPSAVPDLDFPCATSEERAVDVGNMDKGRRKSTPRYHALLCRLLLSFLVHAYNFEMKGSCCFLIFFTPCCLQTQADKHA